MLFLSNKIKVTHLISDTIRRECCYGGGDIGDLDIVEGDETSLKIPKRSSESVNRRRTDNTMNKSKRTKGQTKICKEY